MDAGRLLLAVIFVVRLTDLRAFAKMSTFDFTIIAARRIVYKVSEARDGYSDQRDDHLREHQCRDHQEPLNGALVRIDDGCCER